MKRILMSLFVLVALLVLAPTSGFAQDEDKSERMRDAEQRLEQAAQEIAELAGETVHHVFKTMRHPGGHAGRAMLGINIGRIRVVNDDGTVKESAEIPDGVEIHAVTPGGPADEAGLKSGDVVLALNGQRLVGHQLKPARRLVSLMDDVAPGETVSVTYRRGDEERSAQVTTREFERKGFAFGGPDGDFELNINGEEFHNMPDMMEHFRGFAHLGRRGPWGGLELVPLTPKLGSYFDTDKGLLVVRAPENEAISLEEGDVILAIAGSSPSSPPEAMRLLRFYKPGEKVEMEIRRQKRNRTIRITIPERPQS
ncbi:MAG: PDZ domain-containing protein [Gammaproteobacteria bacterium]|nr:PDZ domain-containing protein [Gammaproteobacteria bacterium]MDH3767601.1 PDZ domain-containing protein [Gammaproteobacteria bacterium]